MYIYIQSEPTTWIELRTFIFFQTAQRSRFLNIIVVKLTHFHKEHVSAVVWTPVDCEGLLLHHSTGERMEINVIAVLHQRIESLKRRVMHSLHHGKEQLQQ